jgi:hypothetical protein
MNTNTDLNKPDPLDHDDERLAEASLTANEKRTATLISQLQQTLAGAVSSKRDLNCATHLLYSLESIEITPNTLAYQELDRLRKVWKKRVLAQNDIDRWMIAHGYPIY